jgi:hypothetical protein
MIRFRASLLLACALGLSLTAGCGDACLTLANQICSCQPDDNSKQVCNAQAKAQEATFPVTTADEAVCQQKIDLNACNCNQTDTAARAACCNRLNTPQGRAACGLVITSP